MEKMYWQKASAKTGLQNLDVAILMLMMHYVPQGQLELITRKALIAGNRRITTIEIAARLNLIQYQLGINGFVMFLRKEICVAAFASEKSTEAHHHGGEKSVVYSNVTRKRLWSEKIFIKRFQRNRF